MGADDAQSINALLQALRNGAEEAGDAVFAAAYAQLRVVARRQLDVESGMQTITPTELVNEVYLKLCGGRMPEPRDRTHFFAIAARAMRQVLIERTRARQAIKRDAGERITLSLADAHASQPDELDLLSLDQALNALEKVDARKAKAVELRLFGGLEFEEIAQQLGVSRATLARDYRAAEAFLRMTMSGASAQ
jgi:RNA polymerase sigma factor (TIGR02999 family)